MHFRRKLYRVPITNEFVWIKYFVGVEYMYICTYGRQQCLLVNIN